MPRALTTSSIFARQAKRLIDLRRAFNLVIEASPRWTLAYFGLTSVQALLPLAVLYTFRLVIDAVAYTFKPNHSASEIQHIWWLIVLCAVANLLVLLFRELVNLVTEVQAEEVTDHLEDVLHSKSVSLDLEFYENDQYQDSLHRAQQEAAFRPTRIVQASAQIVQSAVCLLTISCFLLVSLPWIFSLLLALAAVPGVLAKMAHARKFFQWQCRRTSIQRKVEYYHWMLTGPDYAKEVRLFSLGELFKNRARELRAQLRRQNLALSISRSTRGFLSQSSATLAVFGCFAYFTYRTSTGALSLGALVMLYQAFQRGLGFLSDLLSGLANLYENGLFLGNLYQLLDLKEKVQEPVVPRPFRQPLRKGISFEQVSFRYPGAQSYVLERISFEIDAGEMVAIVGQNGAGKSTLIKLMCRLYDPTEGRITIDGTDLREFSKEDLRRHLSVVFQDFAHYYLPAAENIWLGKLEGKWNPQAVEEAAKQAGIHKRLQLLPNGYSTILGKVFEGGEELSIGEWQRIALARAFLRRSPIILLDEPSSALDAQAEHEMFQKVRELTRSRTSLVISHRLSTVRVADRILVLEKNRITESGTHDELCQQGGQYAALFELQAESYR